MVAFALLTPCSSLMAQSSASFNMEQSVIAGGGEKSSSPSFTLEGTIGQPAAGHRSTSQTFRLLNGFWTFDQLIPTAANVSVSGKVIRPAGQGISLAMVTITDPETNLHKQARTNGFGIYMFSDLPAGKLYVIEVSHPRYRFDVSSHH